MAKLVSKTYGEALFEIASEQGGLREWMEEVNALWQILTDNQEFDKMMKHPGIPIQEKVQILKNVFEGQIREELLNFLMIVITKERYAQLNAIFRYFIDRVKETEKIGVAYVTTAIELNKAQKDAVTDRLLATTSYESMEMHYKVDTALIGGMKIRVGDRVVDSSIRSKLDEMTKQLLQIQLG
ncbi:MAG: F0F1 ATP synthase subunit delta [Acetatifactor sp.]|jgi:F-type H+-transporting ATPase subunit delta|nr:F0F1 ATP synthase subunit delta [Acetatifactor sp.]